jgi:APA family basic amino acid/polyamine antiporter
MKHQNLKRIKRTLSSRSLVAGLEQLLNRLFSLTGIAAAEHASGGYTFIYFLAAVGCAFAGLCYAEFAS